MQESHLWPSRAVLKVGAGEVHLWPTCGRVHGRSWVGAGPCWGRAVDSAGMGMVDDVRCV